MKLFRLLLFTVSLLPASSLVADPKLEVSSPVTQGEQGTEVTINTKIDEQRSGAIAQLGVSLKYQGGLLGYEDAKGWHYDIFRNKDSAIIGFNFRPAAEVNHVIVVTKTSDGNICVISNLANSVYEQLRSLGKNLTEEDKDYFFLQNVKEDRLIIEYRGPKMEKPPTQPFEFQATVFSGCTVKVVRSTIGVK